MYKVKVIELCPCCLHKTANYDGLMESRLKHQISYIKGQAFCTDCFNKTMDATALIEISDRDRTSEPDIDKRRTGRIIFVKFPEDSELNHLKCVYVEEHEFNNIQLQKPEEL